MKKVVTMFLVLAFLAGCAVPSSQLGYSVIKNTKEPITATAEEKALRKGEACGVNFLGFIAAGDFSILKAKQKGSITKVATVDSSVFSLLGIFAKKCTIVTGV